MRRMRTRHGLGSRLQQATQSSDVYDSPDATGIVRDGDMVLAHHVQLLKAVRVFGVLDVADVLRASHRRPLNC